jgi:predicted acyl esterase
MRILENVPVPMRDGVTTRADVWLPDANGRRPALLVRTGYSKEIEAIPPFADARLGVNRGFAVVVQDIRGLGASGGTFEPLALREEADGYDTIDWVAAQDWCDGRVVMTGTSYPGVLAWFAAASGHPALKAIAPGLSSDDWGDGLIIKSGVPEYGFITTWSAVTLAEAPKRWPDTPERAYLEPDALASIAPWLNTWRAEPAAADYWAPRSIRRRRADIDIPALAIGGWYDIGLAGTIASFAAGRNPRDRLIVGPWGHDYHLSHLVGDANLGADGNGATRYFPWILDFHENVLDDRDPAGPPVLIYVLGAKRWLGLDSWPPDTATTRRFPLPAATFPVDPRDPVPTRGGRGLMAGVPDRGWGVRDQRPTAARADVATLPVGAEGPMFLAGPVTADLNVAATGTTPRLWSATLCVSRPDGTLHNLGEGIARAEPDIDRVRVELGQVGAFLPPGSSLVLLVAGSSFPRWPRPDGPAEQSVRPGSALELSVARDWRQAGGGRPTDSAATDIASTK